MTRHARVLLGTGLVIAGVVAVRTLAAAGAAAPSAAPAGPVASVAIRGPYLLTSLPALGRLTWRCDPARTPGIAHGLPGLALGYRAFRDSASQRLSLTAGGRTVLERTVDPGDSLRLPYLPRRRQTVVIRQFTGAGSVRATITVTFVKRAVGTYCYPYQSPRIDVRMTARR